MKCAVYFNQPRLGSVLVNAESATATMSCPKSASNGKLTKSTRIQAVTALVSTRPRQLRTMVGRFSARISSLHRGARRREPGLSARPAAIEVLLQRFRQDSAPSILGAQLLRTSHQRPEETGDPPQGGNDRAPPSVSRHHAVSHVRPVPVELGDRVNVQIQSRHQNRKLPNPRVRLRVGPDQVSLAIIAARQRHLPGKPPALHHNATRPASVMKAQFGLDTPLVLARVLPSVSARRPLGKLPRALCQAQFEQMFETRRLAQRHVALAPPVLVAANLVRPALLTVDTPPPAKPSWRARTCPWWASCSGTGGTGPRQATPTLTTRTSSKRRRRPEPPSHA